RFARDESVRLVTRPFEGLPGECDWVAMREIVPAATATAKLAAEFGGGDVSRSLADVLLKAQEVEPGSPVPHAGLPGPGPRLQEVLDLTSGFEVTVHEG